MQTFLPYASFVESMRVLDPSRLGNQVYREGMTLIRGGWPHHPASKMWRGYEHALALYLMIGVNELFDRGRNYAARPWCVELNELLESYTDPVVFPPWLGDERIHASHRGVLLWKNPEWYSQFGWAEEPRPPRPDGKMDYVWPSMEMEHESK